MAKVTAALSQETRAALGNVTEELKEMREEIKQLREAASPEKIAELVAEYLKDHAHGDMDPGDIVKIVEQHLHDPNRRSKSGVIGRQAKRAGMTKAEWLVHCEAKGHDPTKMDRDIPNHEAVGSRGGKRVDKRPKGTRQLTDLERVQDSIAKKQMGLFGKKKSSSTKKKKTKK